MKKLNAGLIILSVFFFANTMESCKSKPKDTTVTSPAPATIDTPSAVTPDAPIVISGDDALKTGLADALKDYPTVKGEVTDSVINLSGDLKRADWQKLAPTLNSLHPKKVNSKALTIK